MKSVHASLLLLIFAFFSSCDKSNNYIIQTDTEKYFSQGAISAEQNMQMGQQIAEENRNNTVGRNIPPIKIKDLNGKKYNLEKVLSKETIIVASSSDNGYGKKDIEQNFPKLLRSIDTDTLNFDVICLITTENEDPNQDETNFSTQLRSEYKTIYYIERKEAAKINIWASPTKFYLDKNQTVVYFSMGYIIEEDYNRQEIENGINLMYKKLL